MHAEHAQQVEQLRRDLGTVGADHQPTDCSSKKHDLTIAVMGCRVNGLGETDDAGLGLWCGPRTVNLKRGPEEVGAYSYHEILPRLKDELDKLIAARA